METRKLMKYLSQAINSEDAPSGCPTNDEIAAYIDQTLLEQKREKLTEHFRFCDHCSEVLLQTVKSDEVWNQDIDQEKKKTFSFLPYAAAVILVIFIGFSLTQLPWLNQIQSSFFVEDAQNQTPRTIVQRLTRNQNLETLAQHISEPIPSSLGFAAGLYKEKIAFQSGRGFIDLEIVLKAKDPQKTLDFFNYLKFMYDPDFPELHTLSKELIDDFKQGEPEEKLSQKLKRIELYFQAKNENSFFRFGSWVEGGRLAALLKDSSYFDQEEVRGFIDTFSEKKSFPEVVKSLENVAGILKHEQFDEISFIRLRQTFKHIQALM